MSDSAGGGRGFGVALFPSALHRIPLEGKSSWAGLWQKTDTECSLFSFVFQKLIALFRSQPVDLKKPQLNRKAVVTVMRSSHQTTLNPFALDAFIG